MAEVPEELGRMRESIDSIDRAILELLSARFEVTQEVGKFKHEHDLPATDPAREEEQFQRISHRAKELDVDPELACGIFRLIIDKVVENHQEIRNQAEKPEEV